jgi:DNA-binding SARP family transcriptional activator
MVVCSAQGTKDDSDMNLKIQQANTAALQHTAELLQAHQVVIDAWYASWVDEQRVRVAELHRKKHSASNTRALDRE